GISWSVRRVKRGRRSLRRGRRGGVGIVPAMAPPLVLASQSPRRKELLEILDLQFSIIVPAIDESPRPGAAPQAYVVRVAREKALDVAARVSGSVVLSADTVVTLDHEILGKPADRRDAIRMLTKLSGREHHVYTAVCFVDQLKDQTHEGMDDTTVCFKSLSAADIERYVDREEMLDKAGAYAIQGFAST